MRLLKKIAIGWILVLLSQGAVWGENRPLAKDAPERAQLAAMGYEFLAEEPGATMTFATAPSGMVLGLGRSEHRVAISRFISRREKLSADEDLRLLRKVNELNQKYYLQAVLLPRQIMFIAYLSGPHNTREFAKAINFLELIPRLAFSDGELLELLSEKS